MTTTTLTRRLADEVNTLPTERIIRLADGTMFVHAVGPLSHIDTYRYQTTLTTTETEQPA